MVDTQQAYECVEPRLFFSKKHDGYINSISIDHVEHELMICGGADSAITLWDLNAEPILPEEGENLAAQALHNEPLCSIDRRKAHRFGISKVSWWPFDNALFMTGSYDGSVKVWDSEQLEEVYAFDLESKVYHFDVNSLDENGLVAVGLATPLIRILDLRAAGSAQILKGHHSGSVCAVKWSPTREYMLASGGSDGSVRIWDIRRAEQQLAAMDMLRTDVMQPLTPLNFRRAHNAICNGLAWHPSGDELLSIGLDNKARIWDLTGTPGGGTNKVVNFGPLFHDRRQQTLEICLSPIGDLKEMGHYVFLPSDTGDVLMSQYDDGKLIARLVPPGREIRQNRQACIEARGTESHEFYSGTCEGSVIKWQAP